MPQKHPKTEDIHNTKGERNSEYLYQEKPKLKPTRNLRWATNYKLLTAQKKILKLNDSLYQLAQLPPFSFVLHHLLRLSSSFLDQSIAISIKNDELDNNKAVAQLAIPQPNQISYQVGDSTHEYWHGQNQGMNSKK
jgi:hypothetical protein